MRVIKSGRVVQDSWQRLVEPEAQQLPSAGDLIVPWGYWQAERATLTRHQGNIAVCLQGADNPHELAEALHLFELIALDFPQFKDGRCYSHARLLRERLDYKGELRAVGDVLRDQLFFMQRCGIDSFQVRADKDAQDALKGLDGFSVKYQTCADGAPPIYTQRQQR